MTCYNCGYEIDDQCRFCSICSAPQEHKTTTSNSNEIQQNGWSNGNSQSQVAYMNNQNTAVQQVWQPQQMQGNVQYGGTPVNYSQYPNPPLTAQGYTPYNNAPQGWPNMHTQNAFTPQQVYNPYPPHSRYNPSATNYQGVPQGIDLIARISSRLNTNGIIWYVLGVLQMISAIGVLITAIVLMFTIPELGIGCLISGAIVLCVALSNIQFGKKDMKLSSIIRHTPVEIISKYQNAGPFIKSLILNLFFGGIIGIIGSIMELTLRSFIMANSYQLQMIEEEYISSPRNRLM
ncbi:MAG: hypothetical protein FWF47_05640 [Clostridia bacterium]|nr:hypothetical protein [Clostridia bacterium]